MLNRTYKVDADNNCNWKTPQLQACVKILLDTARNGQVTEDELRAALTTRASELRTRQDPWLIFQYYRPQMRKAGLVQIMGSAEPATVVKPTYWDYDEYKKTVKFLEPGVGISTIQVA